MESGWMIGKRVLGFILINYQMKDMKESGKEEWKMVKVNLFLLMVIIMKEGLKKVINSVKVI